MSDFLRQSDLMTMAGIDFIGSRYIPVGKFVYTASSTVYFHRRISHRGRFKRPHGRTNGPRRYKPRDVLYQPDYDRLKEAQHELPQS